MKYQDPNYSPKLVQRIVLYANIITLTGSSGTADITINDTKNTTGLTISSTLTAAAAAWVLANFTFYKLRGFIVSAASGVITVTPAHGWDTTNRINATIANLTGDLSGTYTGTFTIDGSKARVWEVVLTMAKVNFATPVNMRDGQAVKIIFVASTVSTVTTTSAVYVNGTSITSFDVNTDPYIIDAMWTNTSYSTLSGRTLVLPTAVLMGQTLGSLGQYRTGEIFYPLQDNNGVEITDDSGNQLLIPEQVYIY